MLTTALASLILLPQIPFDVRVASPGLLKHEAVRCELKMTSTQIKNVERALTEYRRSKNGRGWDSQEEKVAVTRFLQPAQLKRLREISLQEAGPVVLIVDFVAEKIGLDSERQKEIQSGFDRSIDDSIKPLEDRVDRMVEDSMREAGDDPAKIRAKSKEISKRADEIMEELDRGDMERKAAAAVLASLKPAERKAWIELLGRPFPVQSLKLVKVAS